MQVENQADIINHLMSSALVVRALISSCQPGMQTMSIPPQVHYNLQLSQIKVLRGQLPEGESNYTLILTGNAKQFNPNTECIISGIQGEDIYFDNIMTENLDRIQQQISENSIGWQNKTSPLKDQFTAQVNYSEQPNYVCQNTCRPHFASSGNFKIESQQVIPANIKEFQNPYGDGKFIIKVTNLDDKKQIMPYLFADAKTGEIDGQLSIFTINDGKYYGFEENGSKSVNQVSFEPQESKEFEINTLQLKGVEWPHGGNRVYFTFVLGDLTSQNFFYFYSACHDKLVGRN